MGGSRHSEPGLSEVGFPSRRNSLGVRISFFERLGRKVVNKIEELLGELGEKGVSWMNVKTGGGVNVLASLEIMKS